MSTTLRKLLLAGAALALLSDPALALSSPASTPLSPQPVVPQGCTLTQTSISTSSTSGQAAAANANRKYIGFFNVGATNITLTPGSSAAVAGSGIVLQPAAQGAGNQGSAEEFSGTSVPTNAFQAISTAAGTLYVEECS